MQVTVDLKDLETIIFATSVIKQIENALVAYKNDPFVKPHLQYGDAAKRLESAMNSAKRANAGTLIDWNGELTFEEATFLKEVEKLFNKTGAYYEIVGDQLEKHQFSYIPSLSSKGCIQIGQSIVGAVWPGDNRPQIKPYPSFQVRLTDRGRSKLEEYESRNRVSTT